MTREQVWQEFFTEFPKACVKSDATVERLKEERGERTKSRIEDREKVHGKS